MSAIWNPRQVLDADPKRSHPCVGIIQGRPCENSIHVGVRNTSEVLLNIMSTLEPDSAAVREIVKELAPTTLCKGRHRVHDDQKTFTNYMNKIAAHVAAIHSVTSPAPPIFHAVGPPIPATVIVPPPSHPEETSRQASQNISTAPLMLPDAATLTAMQPLLRLTIRPPPPNEQVSQALLAIQPLFELLLQPSSNQQSIRAPANPTSASSLLSTVATNSTATSIHSTEQSTPSTEPSTISTTLSTPSTSPSISSESESIASTISLSGSSTPTSIPPPIWVSSLPPTPAEPLSSAPDLSERVAASPSPDSVSSEGHLDLNLHEVRRRPLPDECPICIDEICCERRAVWCRGECGYSVHRDCFETWRDLQQALHQDMDDGEEMEIGMKCVCCRADWVEQ